MRETPRPSTCTPVHPPPTPGRGGGVYRTVIAALAMSCSGPQGPATAVRSRLLTALDPPFALATTTTADWTGPVEQHEDISVRAIALPLDQASPAFELAMLELEPRRATDAGVVVAHGHFGEGKGDPTAQDIAWRLARRGARVVVVDTPGVEEWDVPSRQIHGDGGAHPGVGWHQRRGPAGGRPSPRRRPADGQGSYRDRRDGLVGGGRPGLLPGAQRPPRLRRGHGERALDSARASGTRLSL